MYIVKDYIKGVLEIIEDPKVHKNLFCQAAQDKIKVNFRWFIIASC